MEYMWMQTFGLPTDSSIPSEREKQLSTGLATVQLQVERNPLREIKAGIPHSSRLFHISRRV
jgi:hypothetical protein